MACREIEGRGENLRSGLVGSMGKWAWEKEQRVWMHGWMRYEIGLSMSMMRWICCMSSNSRKFGYRFIYI